MLWRVSDVLTIFYFFYIICCCCGWGEGVVATTTGGDHVRRGGGALRGGPHPPGHRRIREAQEAPRRYTLTHPTTPSLISLLFSSLTDFLNYFFLLCRVCRMCLVAGGWWCCISAIEQLPNFRASRTKKAAAPASLSSSSSRVHPALSFDPHCCPPARLVGRDAGGPSSAQLVRRCDVSLAIGW